MSDSYGDITQGDSEVAKYLRDVLKAKRNPGAVVKVGFAHLRSVMNGDVNIVDPTNPFTWLVETAAINTVAGVIDNEANTRKQYPRLAQTEDDLYLHMSDKEYIDRFATPVKTVFTIAIRKDDLINNLVPVGLTGIKKITIPRNTFFTVNETTFSLQYPIDIKQLIHGGLEITYNTDKTTPLQTLSTNVVSNSIRKLVTTQDEWIFIDVDVAQFSINSTTTNISPSSGLTKVYKYTDKFYYIRIYQKNNNTGGQWQEIATTHSDQVYDLTKPTANVRVFEDRVQVSIPQIYLTNNVIRGDLRVDIYQTKGFINMNLSNYSKESFSVQWVSYDRSEMDQYVSPLSVIPNLFTYSELQVTGGKEPISFDELRDRVILNAVGDRDIPITNVQIEKELQDEGYEIVKNTDVVTKRIFLATKPLPKPFDERLITAAATSIESLVVTAEGISNHPYVKDNGLRICLTPEMLYRNNNGIIEIVSIDEQNAILGSDPEVQAALITKDNLLYTPFHYVLDNSTNEFEVRPYYLNDPKSLFATFISQNDTTMLQVNTRNHTIRKTDTGYVLRVSTRSNAQYKAIADNQVQAQLSFTPVGQNNRAYLNGTLVGKDSNDERLFEFIIDSNTDIDSNDNLFLNNFKMFDLEDRKLRTSLLTNIDVFYTTSAPVGSGWTAGAIDAIMGKYLLPSTAVGITNDRLEIRFGYSLKTLWSRSRSGTISEQYQRYTYDVPKYWDKVVYKRDPITGEDFTIDGNTGQPVFEVLYRPGDIVMENNQIVLEHRIGDIMLDPNGNPIPINSRLVAREIDIMFIEGAYYFATDTASATYRSEIVNAVVVWLTNDLAKLSTQLLEETKIYYYPKTNMGKIRVLVENGRTVNIDAGHSFNVKLYVNDTVYQNTDLRNSLSTNTVRVLDNCLKKTLVSVDDIIDSLKTTLGADVLAIDCSNLNGDYPAFTILDEADRASLKKKLLALPNNKLIVSEDVNIEFVDHQLIS